MEKGKKRPQSCCTSCSAVTQFSFRSNIFIVRFEACLKTTQRTLETGVNIQHINRVICVRLNIDRFTWQFILCFYVDKLELASCLMASPTIVWSLVWGMLLLTLSPLTVFVQLFELCLLFTVQFSSGQAAFFRFSHIIALIYIYLGEREREKRRKCLFDLN